MFWCKLLASRCAASWARQYPMHWGRKKIWAGGGGGGGGGIRRNWGDCNMHQAIHAITVSILHYIPSSYILSSYILSRKKQNSGNVM